MMKTDSSTQAVSLRGEIVEIIEKDNKRFAKIALTPSIIEIACESIPDTHLGDPIMMKASVSIKSIKPCFNRTYSASNQSEKL